jgi:arsenate reductase (thioredoxin)
LRVLEEAGIATTGLHSKSWDVFGGAQAIQMDLIITVCDNAAGETCPYWPGHPASAHWGYADPSAATGDEEARLQAFRGALARMRPRMQALVEALGQVESRAQLQAWVQAQGNGE